MPATRAWRAEPLAHNRGIFTSAFTKGRAVPRRMSTHLLIVAHASTFTSPTLLRGHGEPRAKFLYSPPGQRNYILLCRFFDAMLQGSGRHEPREPGADFDERSGNFGTNARENHARAE
jgi:hypothetical protein